MTFIHFNIKGEDLNLDNITETLQLMPTMTYKKNEERVIKDKNIIYQEDAWIYSIEIEDEDTCEKHIEQFIKQLSINKEYINNISVKNVSVYIEIVIYSENYQYHICIKNDLIKKMGEMGLDIWFTYMF